MNRRLILAALPLALVGGRARGETYPSRAIALIVPFAPGGATDFTARILQPKLIELLGQQIVIDNRPGAAGIIGTEVAAKAAPDGYTLFLGNVGTLSVNPSVFEKTMKFDPLTAFAPVALVGDAPDILIANPSFPPSSARELVEYVRARPGQVAFASPGAGSLNRLEMELFRKLAGLDMVHVPYKGGAGQAVNDIIGGHVPVMFTTIASSLGHIQGGAVKALAVAARERIAALPKVPTMIEEGYADFVASSWAAVLAPAGTPAEIVSKLHRTLVEAMNDPKVRDRFLGGGVEPVVSRSPEEFAAFMAAETKRWGDVARDSGATAD